MAIFARVAMAGSLSQAARELGVSASAVSQQLRALEQALGVALLHRSTRKLTLTEAGTVYLEGCRAMLAAAGQAEQRLAELREAAVGELRITTSLGFASTHLAPALAPLLLAHPGLGLHLRVTDERVDLIAERMDLGIRIGHLADSSLVARRLGDMEEGLFAAPAYLTRRGLPREPADLAGHDWLALSVMADPAALELSVQGGEPQRVRMTPRLLANNAQALAELAIAGLGICRQPVANVQVAARAGRLLRVLPDWQLPPLGIYAVTPRREEQPAKVRYAVAALQQYFEDKARLETLAG